MNTCVDYHSALLVHFPPEDTKIAEELHGALQESPHNKDLEEMVNLLLQEIKITSDTLTLFPTTRPTRNRTRFVSVIGQSVSTTGRPESKISTRTVAFATIFTTGRPKF